MDCFISMCKLYGVFVWPLKILLFFVLPNISFGKPFFALKRFFFLVLNVQCINLMLFHLVNRIYGVMRKL